MQVIGERMFSFLFGIFLRVDCWVSHGNFMFVLRFKELPSSFLKQLYHFTFRPAVYEGFHLSTSLPILVIYLFDCGHSSKCEVVSHRGFDLHFPNY